MSRVKFETWLKALRSKKYKQGKSFLRRDNKFCCLGVLADLYNPDGWVTIFGESYYRYIYQELETVIEYINPNKLLYEQISLKKAYSLASMNDAGASFEMIADYLEDKTTEEEIYTKLANEENGRIIWPNEV